jgi:hypothetical protein
VPQAHMTALALRHRCEELGFLATSQPPRVTSVRATAPSPHAGHIGRIVAGSLATGLIAALLLAAAPFISPTENDVTGAVLCGFALGISAADR